MASLFFLIPVLLLLTLLSPARVGSHVSWDTSFLDSCSSASVDDVRNRALLCYRRFEEDRGRQSSPVGCCPDWRLADCILKTVGPACGDEEERLHLLSYWRSFFTRRAACLSIADSLDQGSLPSECAWFYHWILILRSSFALLALAIVITCLVTAACLANSRRRRLQQDKQANGDMTLSYESFNFHPSDRRGRRRTIF